MNSTINFMPFEAPSTPLNAGIRAEDDKGLVTGGPDGLWESVTGKPFKEHCAILGRQNGHIVIAVFCFKVSELNPDV